MKNLLLTIIACFGIVATANAQNSSIEEVQQKTEIEKFLDESLFYKVVELTEYSDNGLEVYGKVFIDLKDEKKMAGGVHLQTESKMGKAFLKAMAGIPTDDGSSKDLGYIDMDQLDGLIAALDKIITEAKSKAAYYFSIEYVTRGGVGIKFTRDGDDDDDNFLQFVKKVYYTNDFGTLCSFYRYTEKVEIKGMEELITTLRDTKTRVNEFLQDPSLLTKYASKEEMLKANKKAAKEAKKEEKKKK